MRRLAGVLYTAAHGGFEENVPLGGGAAVARLLLAEWRRVAPFDVTLISPAILGDRAPSGRDLIGFGERDYGEFCRRFEYAATEEVLRHDPASVVVLSNDVSEGPDFHALAERGYRVCTIYHVDVVAYVSRIYGGSLVTPRTLVRWYERIRRLPVPDIARLIFDKQRDSLRYSHAVVVPSNGVRDGLLDAYPWLPPDRVHVIPWGNTHVEPDAAAVEAEAGNLRREYGVPEDAAVLLTLSRISPEKGIDLLLDTLLEWERRSDFPRDGLCVFICGEAAYMHGRRYLERLRMSAARLRRARVIFTGHVTGLRKAALFRLADIYVFPSRHESYGLTLMEALAAGLPAVCVDHHGARSIMRPEFGELVPEASAAGLREALAKLLADPERRRRMGAAAAEFARRRSFSESAAELGRLLVSIAPNSSALRRAFPNA